MPATIDATVGGATANSYLTLQESYAFAAAHVDGEAWEIADTAALVRALISATGRLDQEGYIGWRANPAQALEWPRFGILLDGRRYSLPSDAIPPEIRRATAVLALRMLSGQYAGAPSELAQFESVKVGPLEVVPAKPEGKTDELPAEVRREIRPFLAGAGSTIRLRRG